MKRLFPLSIVLAMLVGAIISSPKAANGQSAGLVSAVLNRMERNRQSLKSLKASLSMEKYNAQLRDKDNYSGWVLYQPATGRDASVTSFHQAGGSQLVDGFGRSAPTQCTCSGRCLCGYSNAGVQACRWR